MLRRVRVPVEEALEFGPGNCGRCRGRIEALQALQEGGEPFTDPDPSIKERRSWLVLARGFNEKGSREFVCGPFDDALASYARDTNRMYEEVLYGRQPAKLFIEFTVPKAAYEEESTVIIDRIKKYVNEDPYRVNEPGVELCEFTRSHGELMHGRVVFDLWCYHYKVIKYVLEQALMGYDGPASMREINPDKIYFVDMPFSARPGFEPWIPVYVMEPLDVVWECASFLVSGRVPSEKERNWHFNPMPFPPFPFPEARARSLKELHPDIRTLSPLVEQYDLARELGFPVTETANVFTYTIFIAPDDDDSQVIMPNKSQAFVAVIWNKGPDTKHVANVLPAGARVFPVHKLSTGNWTLAYLDVMKDEIHHLEFPPSAREFRVVHVTESRKRKLALLTLS